MSAQRCVIYTVLTGGYDDLRQPEEVCPGCDYICFSNSIPEKQIGVWRIRPFDYHPDDLSRESRYPKLNPHLVLPEYEYSLYTDANIALRNEVCEKIRELAGREVSLAMIPHPDRNCVYREAVILTAWRIGDPGLIYRQVRFLLENHFPQDAGLFSGGMIFRRHLRPDIVRFSEQWWDFYSRYSSRDQLAVSWALFQTGLKPEILFPASFYEKNLYQHREKRRRIENFTFAENLQRYFALLRLKLLYRRYGIG